ncbi:DpnD/PcfM-like protein [Arcicella aurantiaca]|uniref:DpnD/PcfM-like protein n=1 Tax=Arcicella aurantiaca TaxID=591202 RepID=A0A316DHM8_9BACT|nr:DpnD/PcfM family protein [Arcicella aurantiaca]PWK16113.1 DpnD/PcfM-like protein [Arcicella aurantiaca]
MPIFVIEIEETSTKHFRVEAETADQAKGFVTDKYQEADEDFVLSASDYCLTKFTDVTNDIHFESATIYSL